MGAPVHPAIEDHEAGGHDGDAHRRLDSANPAFEPASEPHERAGKDGQADSGGIMASSGMEARTGPTQGVQPKATPNGESYEKGNDDSLQPRLDGERSDDVGPGAIRTRPYPRKRIPIAVRLKFDPQPSRKVLPFLVNRSTFNS